MISKYLSDIGIKEEALPWNWNKCDPRQEYWLKQREIYGFDERDTWNLDYTIILLIYPRLKMYNEVNCVDTSYHKFNYKDHEYVQQECIDKILEGFELYLTKEKRERTNEDWDKIQDAMMLFAIILPSLWW